MLQLLEEGPFFEELPGTSKKQVLVLATSVPVTDGGEEVAKMPCIYYLVRFQKNQRQKCHE